MQGAVLITSGSSFDIITPRFFRVQAPGCRPNRECLLPNGFGGDEILSFKELCCAPQHAVFNYHIQGATAIFYLICIRPRAFSPYLREIPGQLETC